MRARVLVISEDPVGAQMGGNAIRAYEIARTLGHHADVTLAAPSSPGTPSGVDRTPSIGKIRARCARSFAASTWS